MSIVNPILAIEKVRKNKGAPKNKKSEWIVSFFPIIAMMILELNYFLVPNHGTNQGTFLYPGIIAFIGLIFIFRLLWGVRNEKIRKKNRYKAPFHTLLFLFLTFYDYLTLKTGILMLPYFPWPDSIINAALNDRVILWDSILNSMKLLFLGYLFGVGAGLLTGIWAGWSKTAHYWISPLIKILGPIPATTWLPIILILASSLFGGSVFLIALGVWYPVTITSLTGIAGVRKSFYEVAQTLGASERHLIFKIAIPAASSNIFAGLTQGMSIACNTLIVAEMMGVESGLGWYMNWQRGWAEFSKMYAALIVICLTFTVVNNVLSLIKKRALRWQEGTVK